MFAALTTVQAPIVEREAFILLEKNKSWFEDRLPMLDERVRTRLSELSRRLGDGPWLDEAFSAGDLLMINVLRRPACSAMLPEFPNLAAYVARGEARLAFIRAFEAQHAVFMAASQS
jgi:glutathione S-transferase